MASSTTAILSHNAGLVCGMVTAPSAANQLFPKGTIVTRNATGYAVSPSTADVSGFPALGVSKATYDNRTGAEAGGTAGDLDVEIDPGVHAFAYTGTAPIVDDLVYVVDNQTVSTSDLGGTRGYAGVVTEVRTMNGTAKAFVQMGPNAVVNLLSRATARIDVPIFSGLLLATGAPMAVFADGASSVPGVQVTDSEVASVRWNNHAAPAAIVNTVYVPAASDAAAPCVVHALVSKTGATLADATSLTFAAFMTASGDLHDADADAGGASSAITGDAAAKTLQEVTFTLAGTDVPNTAFLLTLMTKPTAGLLGTDDLCLHAIWVTR